MPDPKTPPSTTIFGLLEALGIMLFIVGAGAVVAAAYMLSPTLAVLASGVFMIFGGIVAVFTAAALEARASARTKATP